MRRLNDKARPVHYAIDGLKSTYFQSENDISGVNVTIDFGIPHELTNVQIHFGGRVPYAFALMKAVEENNWVPFQVKDSLHVPSKLSQVCLCRRKKEKKRD